MTQRSLPDAHNAMSHATLRHRAWAHACSALRASIVACFLIGLAACGSSNALGGSMDTVFSLDFAKVEVTYRQKSLVVQYLSGADVVCQVVINSQAAMLVPNATISGAPFVQTVTLYRAAASGGSFPDVQNGTLVLGEYATTAGSAVSGKFNATLADGHTLIGAFDGTVQSVVQ